MTNGNDRYDDSNEEGSPILRAVHQEGKQKECVKKEKGNELPLNSSKFIALFYLLPRRYVDSKVSQIIM